LIWRRFVASRMAPAVYDQTQVEIEGAAYIFRATGSVLAFDGFYAVWPREEENGAQDLPALADGEALDFYGLKPEQHFSQPPPRYSEATLIKELEQRGIGRPSTYAPIVETITKDHGYVEIKDRRLHPTEIGEAVNSIMAGRFSCAPVATASSSAARGTPNASTSRRMRRNRRPSRPARSARSAGRASSSSGPGGMGRSSRARDTPSASTEPTWARTERRKRARSFSTNH